MGHYGVPQMTAGSTKITPKCLGAPESLLHVLRAHTQPWVSRRGGHERQVLHGAVEVRHPLRTSTAPCPDLAFVPSPNPPSSPRACLPTPRTITSTAPSNGLAFVLPPLYPGPACLPQEPHHLLRRACQDTRWLRIRELWPHHCWYAAATEH